MLKKAIHVKSIVNNLTRIRTLFIYTTTTIIIILLLLTVQTTTVLSDHIMDFSGASYTHVAYESWRPCLNGYVRFDIQTKSIVGTLAYIDDKGKYDFFYLKLVEGKLRLLFNLGSERQALNVEYIINDNYWHTIEIQRNGRITTLIVDNGKVQNSTITEKEDLYFGGSTANEYQSSLFYFGGIPTMLERHNYGNLSSYDVYLQPRFKGKMRNIVYKNCTKKLVKPVQQQMEGVSLIDDNNCNHSKCKHGVCMIKDDSYWCLCDETSEGMTCEDEKKSSALTFKGKQYLSYQIMNSIESYDNETLSFKFKTNKQYGLIFYASNDGDENQRFLICFERGNLLIEYRLNSNVSLEWRPILTSTGLTNSLITSLTNGGNGNGLMSTLLYNWNNGGINGGSIALSDDKWHLLRITRRHTILDLTLDDEYHVVTTHDQPLQGQLKIKQIYLGGTTDDIHRSTCNYKFQGCLKDVVYSIGNERLELTQTYLDNDSSMKIKTHGNIIKAACETIMESITFLTSNSYLTIDLINDTKWNQNYDEQIELSFRTTENYGILFYAIGTSKNVDQSFFGLDLFDGFLYLTINIEGRRNTSKRKEITNRRYNDGNQHHIRIHIRRHTGGLDISVFIDQESEERFSTAGKRNKLHVSPCILG
ncbi:unnamed protein product [Didymodactylos carnosus]|uniref:Neurexin IV n=1 Tax=Didymodactylos carnosus TaxID=1234261 RepID=A0A8S2D8L1_9BILA|nr:unnamed protein product [Didymodactylos carnosus]CAF3617858.1 unnamed protein product [Didymodactylos carnosus]